ncbi:hypothetical protein ACLIBG_02030 [Virgibacillus sp. W0181]|uniref:hypothetical protein n=1 Tax=Virgibacillus sp. W0181 TaxID=3391581 RepID=UPI003F44DDA5
MSFWAERKGFDQQKYQEELDKITIEKIEKGMEADGFSENVKKELLSLFEERIRQQGLGEFKMYIYNLHFMVPQEIEDEKTATKLYENNEAWFEKEISNLENELQLSYEKQSEDLEPMNVKARKAQLVIRHRFSSIILDILSNPV